MLIVWLRESIFGKGHYQQTTVILTAVTFLLTLIANSVIHLFYWHARPFVTHRVHQLIAHSATESSFVSDHALLAFSVAIVLLQRMKRLGYAAFAFAILTGASRIFVGVHYPADIIGSVFIASAVGWLVVNQEARLRPITAFIISTSEKVIALTPAGKRISRDINK
ncbi:phosphatase PAP2 family protein [Neobacillus bataviensis]|uniref:phosphatase PAP2 family protein n=1 Tax=Neobacillus bataviensis TaxID=220685 RepID=UPI0012FA20B3|nr:phosphatase PAP2 family protein [Neobacillus bataviensis]